MTTVSPENRAPGPIELPPFDYDQAVRDLVLATAPRVFALVGEETDEDGERDAWVVAWGFAHPDDGPVQVISDDGREVLRLKTAERAVWWFARLTGGPVRLEWLDAVA
ncbi:hypothetical protein [Streptomyces sp. 6N223]|uniref:hypothetical protein n=1 Tax=Streptomyces sp. 6N223 TaxID=3457412 RepID=UPI003FD09E20